MKNSKKGISLIVLVITIIVIIILAAAVLLSIQNNNPINNANKARYSSDADAAQSAFNILMGKVMADCEGSVEIEPASGKLEGASFYIGSGSNKTYVFVDNGKYNLKGEGEKFVLDIKTDLGINNSKTDTYTLTDKGVVADPAVASM